MHCAREMMEMMGDDGRFGVGVGVAGLGLRVRDVGTPGRAQLSSTVRGLARQGVSHNTWDTVHATYRVANKTNRMVGVAVQRDEHSVLVEEGVFFLLRILILSHRNL